MTPSVLCGAEDAPASILLIQVAEHLCFQPVHECRQLQIVSSLCTEKLKPTLTKNVRPFESSPDAPLRGRLSTPVLISAHCVSLASSPSRQSRGVSEAGCPELEVSALTEEGPVGLWDLGCPQGLALPPFVRLA